MTRHNGRLGCLNLLSVVIILSTHPVAAQQSPQDADLSDDEKALASIADYVIQHRMIVPGKGLSVAAIGTEVTALSRTLGEPLRESKSGLLSKNKQYFRHYALDDGTQLVVTGKDTVESINLIGTPTSRYMTQEGVTFGLPAQRIASVYGAADISESELIYDRLGIAFRFKENALSEIVVAKPGALKKDPQQ